MAASAEVIPIQGASPGSRPRKPPGERKGGAIASEVDDWPNSLEAERGTLGAMLHDNSQIAEIAPLITDQDFWRDSHQALFRAILKLSEGGGPVDPIRLTEELERTGQYDKIGGLDGVADLLKSVPHGANGKWHAQIVKNNAICREIMQAGIACYEAGKKREGTAEDILSAAVERFVKLGQRSLSCDGVEIRDAIRQSMELMEERENGKIDWLSTGLADLDGKVYGLAPGQLIVVGARPSIGKTALALTTTASVVRYGPPGRRGVLFVTLEMSAGELASRLMAMESKVDSGKFRWPLTLQVEERQRIGHAQHVLRSTDLIIDDQPSRSLLQICSLARRISGRRDFGLGLVVVDYLQLIAGTGNPDDRKDSRQEQVAKLSRGLKMLSRELRVPVMALSQLSRATEQHKDKRPSMADLRECLPADQLIIDAHNGVPYTVGQMVQWQANGVGMALYGLNAENRIESASCGDVWAAGVKQIFKVRTKTGRTVRCSEGHRFLTVDGWKELKDLSPGCRIACPRFLPEPIIPAEYGDRALDHADARLLGYLISDGSYLKHRAVSYAKPDAELIDDIRSIVKDKFGIEARDKQHWSGCPHLEFTSRRAGCSPNPLIGWLKELGIYDQRGQEKRVPSLVFGCPNDVLASFLGALWAGDGCISKRRNGYFSLKFSSTSMALLSEVQTLLLRFGVISVLGKPGRASKSTCDIADLMVRGGQEIVRFADSISIPGIKSERLAEARAACSRRSDNSHIDRLPVSVTDRINSARVLSGLSHSELGYRCQGKQVSPSDVRRAAERLGCRILQKLASHDILWDAIDSIGPDGMEETYDLSVPGINNYVVGNIFTHNSGAIEQDADKIILIHRPDFYDEHDKPGEAELIIVKHRNGPTGVVPVSYQKQWTLFTDLSHRQEDFPA